MVAQRIGEVAGAEALADYINGSNQNDREIARCLMAGWVKVEGKAATDWFQKLDPTQQRDLRSILVEGVAWTDPAQALEIVFQGSADTQESDAATAMVVALGKAGIFRGGKPARKI